MVDVPDAMGKVESMEPIPNVPSVEPLETARFAVGRVKSNSYLWSNFQ